MSKAIFSVFILILCVLAVGSVESQSVFAARSDRVTVAAEGHDLDPTLVLTMGKADVVDLEGEVSDILVADPSIIRVDLIQSNRLYLVGAAIGNTNIIAVGRDGNILRRMNIHVRIDEVQLQSLMDDMFPDEDVRIKTAGGQVMLAGTVSTPSRASQVTELAGNFLGEDQTSLINMLEVTAEDQVMLQVRILEVARSLSREFGIRPEFPQEVNQYASDAGSIPALGSESVEGIIGTISETIDSTTGLPFLADTDVTDSLFQTLTGSTQGSFSVLGGGLTGNPFASLSLFNDDIAPFLLTIDALEDEDLVKTLAEPNLTAKSGEEAGFLAGGEFPVPSGVDSNGYLVPEFRPFGVSLNFRPVVLSNERISLELYTEVSEVSEEVSITIASGTGGTGVSVPGRNIRRANTNVELPSGGSLMIAGLLQSEVADGYESLPGIKNTPILGDLMKSERFRRDESELVIIITPILVKPYAGKGPVEEVPQHRDDPLTKAFAANIRRTYGDLKVEPLLADNSGYGYLID